VIIASWNVNSISVRLEHVLKWLQANSPDHLCLQELKTTQEKFPLAAFEALGYTVKLLGEKTYNGVAVLSKIESEQLATSASLNGFPEPLQSRLIEIRQPNKLRLLNLYVPNGFEVGSPKYSYKLAWLEALNKFVEQELMKDEPLVVVGDFNIAPTDLDVHDPQLWQNQILVSRPERQMFENLLDLGLLDSFREFQKEGGFYSWWDYRQFAFKRNAGLRIDHILISKNVKDKLKRSWIDKAPRKLEKPSDHAPVLIEIDL
jgi:exodeoxyribonuclease-3